MNNELYHYGVQGMKWGVRRYQNKDGSLTPLGKRHAKAALKGLYDMRTKSNERAEAYDVYNTMNRKALKESKDLDRKNGEISWATQSLTDAYRATGKAWINAKLDTDTYDAYVDAYSKGTIKIGQDYVVKNRRKGIVELTDSGRSKEREIADKVLLDAGKKYSKEIKEYGLRTEYDQMTKTIKRRNEIGNKYSKLIAQAEAAGDYDRAELLQFDWLDELDRI